MFAAIHRNIRTLMPYLQLHLRHGQRNKLTSPRTLQPEAFGRQLTSTFSSRCAQQRNYPRSHLSIHESRLHAHWKLDMDDYVYRAVSYHPRTLQGAHTSLFRPACSGPGLAGGNAATAVKQSVGMDEGALAALCC